MPTRTSDQNKYLHGAWNALCDICGFKFKSVDLKKRWDGMMCCKDDWEARHPSDTITTPKSESSPPWTRGETNKIQVLDDPQFVDSSEWNLTVYDGTVTAVFSNGQVTLTSTGVGHVLTLNATLDGNSSISTSDKIIQGKTYDWYFGVESVGGTGTAKLYLENEIVWQHTDGTGDRSGTYTALSNSEYAGLILITGNVTLVLNYFYLWTDA